MDPLPTIYENEGLDYSELSIKMLNEHMDETVNKLNIEFLNISQRIKYMNDMFDKSLPGTMSEHTHIGNPEDKQVYYYMKSYSPYDNVISQNYPAILTTCGLNDSRVFFWEPAKWVAKLRSLKTDRNILLLHTNMDAGHGGQSGRFRQYRETALQYAFLLDLAGIRE